MIGDVPGRGPAFIKSVSVELTIPIASTSQDHVDVMQMLPNRISVIAVGLEPLPKRIHFNVAQLLLKGPSLSR